MFARQKTPNGRSRFRPAIIREDAGAPDWFAPKSMLACPELTDSAMTIEALQRCVVACTTCLAHSIGKPVVNQASESALDCMEICELAIRALARQSEHRERYCRLAAELCEWCADQCGELDEEYHHACAVACAEAVQACKQLQNLA